jgi:hypothetical protein
MINPFLAAMTVLLPASGGVGDPGANPPAVRRRASAGGTNSTPGRVRARATRVRRLPLWPALGGPAIPLRGGGGPPPMRWRFAAGSVVRQNFTSRVVGRIHGRPVIEAQVSSAGQMALPFGHYRMMRFSVRQGTEAREIDATLGADFVADTFTVRGVRGRLGACYVKRWLVRMDGRPY